jgi:hypothetical protein
VDVDGSSSAGSALRAFAPRPLQEPAPSDTAVDGSQPPTTDVGVHLIHHVPGGMACVQDQVERIVKPDETLKDLLYRQYEDPDVAETLAQQNDLVPDEQGAMTVYVPSGEPVVIPAMCYTKSGADAVSLQPSGEPEPPSPIGGFLVLAFILLILYLILIAAGNVRGRWKS